MYRIDNRILDARVVLMCGISGSGKTVFARSLEKLGFIRISTDELLWEKYGRDFFSLPLRLQQDAFIGMNAVIESLCMKLVDEGKNVVVDATMCKKSKRDQMRERCRRIGIQPVIVYMDAPFEVLRNRLSKRKGTGPDDLIVDEIQLRKFCSGFEFPGYDENPVVISQVL